MDKKEAKRLGAWISLLGGFCFVLGAIAAFYIAFYLKPETATRILATLGRMFHHM
jgi:hypothetical protein